MRANYGFLPNLTDGGAGGCASFPTRSPLIYSDAELMKLSWNNVGELESGWSGAPLFFPMFNELLADRQRWDHQAASRSELSAE
jgi:hypothetical protein